MSDKQIVTVSLPARPSYSYAIQIERGICSHVGELCTSVIKPCSALLLSDDTVNTLYGERVATSLTDAGYHVIRHIIPHGEASKSAQNLLELLEHMAHEHITRTDCIIALGGGVVGDLGGFASAIYLRGIRFIQIPTTLLAMVDASVGGKTAIDLEAGKNLAGAFHQPSLVICDPEFLKTLPPETFADGMAEVIKYAFIRDRTLYDLLVCDQDTIANIPKIIHLCIEDKRALVEADETDKGLRQLLNLGHTIGHAIEACSHFAISHGSAVAIGMLMITRASERAGIATPQTTDALQALLEKYHLPTSCPFTTEELYSIASSDKKRTGNSISLVVPYGIADSRLVSIPMDALESYIRAGLE